MSPKAISLLLAVCMLVLATGCTHVQLRKNSVHEAEAVGDMQVQQVLDNLAMFVYDYNAMPYFSFVNQGTASVNDQANGSMSLTFARPITSSSFVQTEGSNVFNRFFTPPFFLSFLLNQLGLSGGAQRACQDAFTIIPINDPRKLELMRCAYQTAVSSCGFGTPPRSCPDCQARFNSFYTGDAEGKISQKTEGTITSDCLKSDGCWFHAGCKKDVPKDCCMLVGHYCDVYIWVLPDGRDELTKLTLAILDYAVNSPPQRLTKDVTYFVDPLGLPTTQKDGVGTVKATIGINERNESLLNLPQAQEVELEQQLQDRIRRLSAELAENQALPDKQQSKDLQKTLNDAIEDARQKLYFLDQQLRNGGLKEQFSPPGTTPIPGSADVLQFQQLLNTVPPTVLPTPAAP